MCTRAIKAAVRISYVLFLALLLLPALATSATQPSWLKQYSVSNVRLSVENGLLILRQGPAIGAAKLDVEGNIVWSNAYIGAESIAYYSTVVPDADGYVILARPQCQFGANCDTRVQLVKLDAQGEVVWSNSVGAESAVVGMDVLPFDGEYVIAGARGPRGVEQDAWLLKVDGNGNILWQHTYGTTEGWEYARLIRPYPNGYVIAGSATFEGVSGNSIWLIMTDAHGSTLVQKTYSRGPNQFVEVEAMHVEPDGILLAGRVHELWSQYKAFVMRVSFAGDIQWQKYYEYGKGPRFSSIHPTDEGYLVAGSVGLDLSSSSDNTVWVLKLDSVGDVVWEHTIGASDIDAWGKSIAPHEDGFIVGGNMYKNDNWNTQQAFALRVQTDGTMPGCSWLGSSNANVAPGDFNQNDQGVDYVLDAKPPVEPVTVTISATPSPLQEIVECPPSYGPLGSTRRHCESVLNRRVCELLRFGEFHLSIDERYMACPAACNLSISAGLPGVDDEVMDAYALIREVLVMTHEKEVSPESLKSVIRALEESTFIPKENRDKILAALRNERKVPPDLFEQLAGYANEMAIDLAAPDLSRVRIPATTYAAADFKGVSWLGFRGVEKSGNASLRIVPGLPATPDEYDAGWPIFHYEFDFSGSLARNGFVDIHLFVGGVVHGGPIEELRILEWDGKSYRDITTSVDVTRGVISGTTSRLAKVIVVSPTREVIPVSCEAGRPGKSPGEQVH